MNKFKIPASPLYIIEKLTEAGYQAGLVGGSLRNLILGLEVKDYDIATSASLKTIKETFSKHRIFEYGITYGTLTIMVQEEYIEVTTFRKETGYTDFRHPDEVEFIGNLKVDLSRRDFTINALYYNYREGLIDYFKGRDDLENRLIRCVGDCNIRFKEDPLRILRALRFSAALSFTIEEKTSQAILKHYPLLKNISSERIVSELIGIFKGKNYLKVTEEFYQVFKFIIPKLRDKPLSLTFKPTLELRLVTFFLNLEEKENVREVLKNLKLGISPSFNKESLNNISEVLKYQDYKLKKEKLSHIKLWQNLNWNRTLYEMWLNLFADLEDYYLPQVDFKDLKINGSDLLNYVAKDRIKEVLNELFSLVATGRIANEKAVLLEEISKLLL